MKRKFVLIVAVLAMGLVAAPVVASTTTAELFFTQGNISGGGGLGQFTLAPGEYFAKLLISVVDGGGQASFDLLPGTGSYMGNPVNFAFCGTAGDAHLFGLSISPVPTGTSFAFTPANLASTPLISGNAVTLSLAQANPGVKFDGFGYFNTVINSSNTGFDGAQKEITFTSGTTNFPDANAVLGALMGNHFFTGSGTDQGLAGWLGVVDMGGYYPGSPDTAIFTGMAVNGNPVPIPPSALLLGSGLLGLGLVGWRRKKS